MHRRMCDQLASRGATVDAVYYCPHDEEPPCGCRKPQPGMLFAAATEYKIDLPSSWMIGDSERDVEAGRRAGCRTARIAQAEATENVRADLHAQSLLEAAQIILRVEEGSTDLLAPNIPLCS